jgi:hypothetical protein
MVQFNVALASNLISVIYGNLMSHCARLKLSLNITIYLYNKSIIYPHNMSSVIYYSIGFYVHYTFPAMHLHNTRRCLSVAAITHQKCQELENLAAVLG